MHPQICVAILYLSGDEHHRALATDAVCCLELIFWYTGVWGIIHAVRPQIVGGCRPQDILPYLGVNWSVTTVQTVPGALLRSQLVVAQKQADSS